MSSSTGGADFYNKVAKKFGGYAYGTNKPKYTSVYPNGNPEEVFKEKLLKWGGVKLVALDIGCGDGKFAFSVVSYFSKIVGIDTSLELLKIARQKQKELQIKNVTFHLGDAKKSGFASGSFDIIFNRRGPSFYEEYYRLLKKGGNYLEIGIGEKDAQQLKQTFGRGQDYGNWDRSRLSKDRSVLEKIGFEIISAKDFHYTEYYQSPADLDLFLQGVPIFEDYNPTRDKNLLEKYIKTHTTDKGVELKRHRLVLVAQK